MYFAPGSPQNTPSNLPEEPSETVSADITKGKKLALTSQTRTQSQSIFDPYEQFPQAIVW